MVKIMGILNVTYDSFSDGYAHLNLDELDKVAQELIANGADIIDIGAESTRPNSKIITVDREIATIIPLVKQLSPKYKVSVDTYKYDVTKQALENGAKIINDVSGLLFDPHKVELLREYRSKIVIMHNRLNETGFPHATTTVSKYDNIIEDVIYELQKQVDFALNNGIKKEQIIVDPGLGFAKTYTDNLTILANLTTVRQAFHEYEFLLGSSRKSFIGHITKQIPSKRSAGTLATTQKALEANVDIVRVHDVRDTHDYLSVLKAIEREGKHGYN